MGPDDVVVEQVAGADLRALAQGLAFECLSGDALLQRRQ
jgi:hypothetical protein